MTNFALEHNRDLGDWMLFLGLVVGITARWVMASHSVEKHPEVNRIAKIAEHIALGCLALWLAIRLSG